MVHEYLPATDFLRLIGRLFVGGMDIGSPGRDRFSIDEAGAPPPQRNHAKRLKTGDPKPMPPREDPLTVIRAAGLDRVRRTARAMAMPAAVPEVRRAVSEVAARCGVQIHPIIPGGSSSRLVDEVCNWSPNKLAVEMIRAANPSRLDTFDFHREIAKADGYIRSLQDLVGR